MTPTDARRALILAARAPGPSNESFDATLREIGELLHALDYSVETRVVQKRPPHPTLYVGAGKLSEVKTIIGARAISLVAVAADLRPGQLFRIERELLPVFPDLKVFDRTRIILEVFSARASSKEARLQVERAKLEYEVPFVREWIHRMKTGEHPGYLAGGEQRVDIYYENIKTRRKKIDGELRHLRNVRSTRRDQRREGGFFLVAIGGYANAGKSTLMRTLTGARVTVEDRVFSTLVPVTRRGGGVPVPAWAMPGTADRLSARLLLTDTVGFVQDLPAALLEAFRSTLEEMTLADVVLLVLDLSDSPAEVRRKLRAALRILASETAAPDQAVVLALNKVDRLAPGVVAPLIEGLRGDFPDLRPLLAQCTPVSAATGAGLPSLLGALLRALSRLRHVLVLEAVLPDSDSSRATAAWIHASTLVVETGTVPLARAVRFLLLCKEKEASELRRRVQATGGRVEAGRLPQAPDST